MTSPRLLIASPHRYEDLARLWFRAVQRSLLPALTAAGYAVDVLIFCDGCERPFAQEHFPGARLWLPHDRARDFIHFYDATLDLDYSYLFFLDADVFFLSGAPVAERLAPLNDPEVAAVSFLEGADLPGSIYALCCRREAYQHLPGPVFAPRYDDIAAWPRCRHYDPGAFAAAALRDQGLRVDVVANVQDYLADFHGTTNLRISRTLFGERIGRRRFLRFVSEKPYFLKAGYDNLLLARLYQRLFDEPFAATAGISCAESLTRQELLGLMSGIQDGHERRVLLRYFRRSNLALQRLARPEGLHIALSDLVPL